MPISPKQIRLVHVAKRKLELTDAQFRTALTEVAGVESLKDLDQEGMNVLMGLFEYLGFQPLTPNGQDFGERKGMATYAQLELIRVLWREYTHAAYQGEDELCSWLNRSFGVSSLRFLKKDAARKVITALKTMKSRAA